MSDRLEERLATRLRTLGETVGDELAPPVDLELQVQRRRGRVRATRRWSVVGLAAAFIASAVTVAVVRGAAGGGAVRVETSPTTTAALRDALQPGTVMLAARGRFVISLNAMGHTNATMVTVEHGNIAYARATDDHRAIWYLSFKDGTKACGDVVRANIDGNSSKIVTKAAAFDVSPDGTRLALYGAGNLTDGQCSPVRDGATGEIAVVDIATFESSIVPMAGVTSLRWSPDGSYLVVASCTRSACTGLRRVDVPRQLGAPLTAAPELPGASVRPPGSMSIVFGPDGLYVLGAAAGSPSAAPTQTVDRYEARTLGSKTRVVAAGPQWNVSQVVPTASGTYVIATRVPPAGTTSSLPVTPGLYQVVAGRLVAVRALVDPGILVPVMPLSAG